MTRELTKAPGSHTKAITSPKVCSVALFLCREALRFITMTGLPASSRRASHSLSILPLFFLRCLLLSSYLYQVATLMLVTVVDSAAPSASSEAVQSTLCIYIKESENYFLIAAMTRKKTNWKTIARSSVSECLLFFCRGSCAP